MFYVQLARCGFLGSSMCTRVPTIVSVEGGAEAEGLVVSIDPHYKDPDWTFVVDQNNPVEFGDAIERLTNHMTKVGEIGEAPIYVKYTRHYDFCPPIPASIAIAFLQLLSKEVRGPSWWSRCRTS